MRAQIIANLVSACRRLRRLVAQQQGEIDSLALERDSLKSQLRRSLQRRRVLRAELKHWQAFSEMVAEQKAAYLKASARLIGPYSAEN